MQFKTTARYDPDEVRALVEFASKSVGLDHSGWSVWVKNSKGVARGTCYHIGGFVGRPGKWSHIKDKYITLGIGPESAFPVPGWGSRLAKSVVFQNWKEMLVWVAAHEWGHAYMGPKHANPEANAEWYGWNALTAYRKSL